jgi:predicted RNA binding protein YcfA (HicA-like mRNA interferase family)
MGRLAGFRCREVVQRLRAFGFAFDRQAAGSHEIWFNAATGRYTTVPHHPGDLPEGTLRAILKQAGIDPGEFLGERSERPPSAM